MRKARDFSIDYLRTTLTLLVVAHHSMLAYTTWASFDKGDVFRSTAPVVDSSRWIVFDYAENFNDVFFMSLMFCISGLFVYPAICRHGAFKFARDRLFRLGVPFAVAVAVLMPIALYPSWTLGSHNAGFLLFYVHLARGGFQVGPPWFIWVLLLFDLIAALLLLPSRTWISRIAGLTLKFETHSCFVFLAMVLLSASAYLPLLARSGFSRWTVLFTNPFAFQEARIALYALWFGAGVVIGIGGVSEGLLSRSGALAQHWRGWVVICIGAYASLSVLPHFLMRYGMRVTNAQAIEACLWIASCVASCFAFLAVS